METLNNGIYGSQGLDNSFIKYMISSASVSVKFVAITT